jgi:phage FluMu protein Com
VLDGGVRCAHCHRTLAAVREGSSSYR